MPNIRKEQLNESLRFLTLPLNMLDLPVSSKGYPVPFFASLVNGEWDFRVVHPETTVRCLKEKLCWVCGKRLGSLKVFVSGPMCVITRTSAEPPSHFTCATYSAIACPFLASPRMRRNEKNLPEGHVPPAGLAVMRNPGVAAVLSTRSWKAFPDGNGGILVEMGPPDKVDWYAQRRKATRAEVQESIDSGMPLLVEQADKEGPEAHAELARLVDNAKGWLPAT